MKKQIVCLLLSVLLLLTACAKGPTWQEQYDLGVRYLSDGNYQEAIIAFTAAIEIDPKRVEAYMGRGDAYFSAGESEESLAAAQADYKTVIELDESYVQGYLSLADAYMQQGDLDAAVGLLQTALEKTGQDQAIADKLGEIESMQPGDENSEGVLADETNGEPRDGVFRIDQDNGWYHFDTYENGNLISVEVHGPDDILTATHRYTYNEQGCWIRQDHYDENGTLFGYDTATYDERWNKIREDSYLPDGTLSGYTIYTYDEYGLSIRQDIYGGDGTFLYSTDYHYAESTDNYFSKVD